MKRIKLVQTCGACPEQYDVFVHGEKLGYMRLRHGYFHAEYKNDIVYEASTAGDGCFTSQERHKHLNHACLAILIAHDRAGGDIAEVLYDLEVKE